MQISSRYMKPIIEIKNIGKKYKIRHQRGGYIALRDILANVVRYPFAFLKRTAKQTFGIDTEVFWALKGVSFEVVKGEVVGIIGRNGAGKSTLLKILSQITPPTTGEIKLHGTVGSLLEVGTGFHPELTGRENIFLNGAILGMSKKEIAKKFNAIVTFAGIEQFLDTPVKYYSSGMYVRLAFSVAAHLEPDILIIDEVLAVGDAEFQKKCLGKMEEITEKEGRTILFVSHNLDAVKELCDRTIWIDQGSIQMSGPTQEVVNAYTNERYSFQKNNDVIVFNTPTKEISFKKLWLTDANNTVTNQVAHNQESTIHLEFEVVQDIIFAELTLTLTNSNGVRVISTSLSESTDGKPCDFKKGTYYVTATIEPNLLIPDVYHIRIWAHERGFRDIAVIENAMSIEIVDKGSLMSHYGSAATTWACVLSNTKWKVQKI